MNECYKTQLRSELLHITEFPSIQIGELKDKFNILRKLLCMFLIPHPFPLCLSVTDA